MKNTDEYRFSEGSPAGTRGAQTDSYTAYDDPYDYGYVYTGEEQSGTGERVRRGAERTKRGFERLLDEQPLAVGILALFMGALIALLLPKTRRENALMGEQRDHLMTHAKEVAGKTFQSVKETASSEFEGLKEEAKEIASHAAQAAKKHAAQAAKKTVEDAKETVKQESNQANQKE